MSRKRTARLVRLYAWLLRLLPAALRDEYGEEMARLYADQHRDALEGGGWTRALGLALRSIGRLIGCAVRARRDTERDTSTIGPRGPRRRRGGREMMGTGWSEIRYAVRSLAKRPGFTLTAVLILATGIGSTTAIFSVVDTVVLRQLPYPEAGRLLHFDEGAHSYPNFRAWRAMTSFEALSAARDYEVDLTGEGPPQRIPAAAVSEDFFRLFGAAPHLGRLFGPSDYPGDRSLVLLGHGFWTRLGADPSLIGRTIRLDGRETEVIGVVDPSFVPPSLVTGSRVDVWFPLDDGGVDANDHGFHVLGVAARLEPGVTLEAAQAEVDAERAATAEQVPEQYVRSDGSVEATPLVEMHEATVREVSSTLFLLLGAVGLMLLIACANVANLFLARGTARTREIALRGALGASRGRIVSQILHESVLLALVGGALGVGLAFVGVDLFARFTPGDIPRIESLAVDLRVLWFSVATAVATGVVFGALPALQAVRGDVGDALKEGAATTTTGRQGRRMRSGLVVSEIALAVVLLAGAGLLFRSFVAIASVDPGFDTDGLVILPLELDADYGEEERARFSQELLTSIDALPGTRGAALGWTLPFTFTGASRCCWRTSLQGDPALVDEDDPFLSIMHPVSPGYFSTLGATLLSGREFVSGDAADATPVAILNLTAARALFGTDEVVGRVVSLRDADLTVVGVVEGVHHWGLSQDIEAGVYVPYLQHGPEQPRLEVLVRSDTPLEALADGLRNAVWQLDPELPISTVTTMRARVGSSLAQPRFLSGLLGGFATVALLLACGGIYGSMLYTVGQRRREMGIRLALGAAGADVRNLVLRHGLALTVGGLLIGTGIALALSEAMRSLVWGIQPTDPLTFAGAVAVLGMTALVASFVPAWRASRTDPLQTLRSE